MLFVCISTFPRNVVAIKIIARRVVLIFSGCVFGWYKIIPAAIDPTQKTGEDFNGKHISHEGLLYEKRLFHKAAIISNASII